MQDFLSNTVQNDAMLDCDFDCPFSLGNINRLDTHLEIDGTRYAPCAYLLADDINPSTGAWASRHDSSKSLSVAGAGAAPTYGNYSAIENTAVRYFGAKYHSAADTTWGQLSDKDFAVECIFVNRKVANAYIMYTYGGPPLKGFLVYYNASGDLSFYITDGQIGIYQIITLVSSANLVEGAIYHVFIGGDISTALYGYVNGVYVSTGSTTSFANTISSAALRTGSTNTTSIIEGAIWDLTTNPFPGALKNRTYMDRIARERFEIISGCQDNRKGSMSMTRATSAYLDRYVSSTERQLFRVSSGWPRVCERKDANGTYVSGFLSEPQNINLCIQSEDMDTTWTKENLTSVSTNAIAAPNGETTADGLVGDTDDDVHGVYQALTIPATMHSFSTFAKKGNKNWIHIYSDTTNVSCYFDIDSGVVGTAGAGITASGIEDWGNDWYRCYIIFTGAAAAKNFHLRSAHADTDDTFVGDTTTINTYFWGAQIEAVTERFPSSYIPTTTAAVTRNKDELVYDIRLPIVGNINDLPQALTIGGTDYDPCAYLVADDCQADGTWTSRHAAKSLAFAGAGTNPSPNWRKVSRGNTSVKYWASNYHTAADTTWGQFGTDDCALEAIFRLDTTASQTILTTYASNTGILIATDSSSRITCQMRDGTGALVTILHSTALVAGTWNHIFVGMDRSEKAYLFVNGIIAAGTPSADITGIALTWTSAALIAGTSSPAAAHFAMWSLSGTPWPGAATNQATMASVARSRYNQLCRYESCRLDCEILHPDVDRQVLGVFATAYGSSSDYQYLAALNTEYSYYKGAANGSTQWDALIGSQDICDNIKIKLSGTARPDKASLLEDNTAIGTDTSCEVPSGQTKIGVGSFFSSFQPACLISRAKLFRNDRRS